MSDKLVISFKDSSIYESDLQILKNNNQWLNDSIITFRIEFLIDKFNLDKKIQILSPSVIFLCSFVESEQEIQSIFSQLNLESKELIFIPLNNNRNPEIIGGGSHWSLLVFVKKLNQFLYYDSLNSFNIQDALFVVSKFKFLLNNNNNNSKNLKEFIINQKTPSQNNSYDCGLYVLSIIEELLNILNGNSNIDEYGDILLSDTTKETLIKIITPTYVKEKRLEILNSINNLLKNSKK